MPVTFQVGIVCADGIVVASDGLLSYISAQTQPQYVQHIAQSKFLMGAKRQILCFFAGGPQAEPTARAILSMAEVAFADEISWRNLLAGAADSLSRPLSGRATHDEIIVCRADRSDCFWVITVVTNCKASVLRITNYMCIGGGVPARFLPEQLYNPEIGVEAAKSLALLTLQFASKENPSSIGEPFSVFTLHKGATSISEPEIYSVEEVKSKSALFVELLRVAFWKADGPMVAGE